MNGLNPDVIIFDELNENKGRAFGFKIEGQEIRGRNWVIKCIREPGQTYKMRLLDKLHAKCVEVEAMNPFGLGDPVTFSIEVSKTHYTFRYPTSKSDLIHDLYQMVIKEDRAGKILGGLGD